MKWTAVGKDFSLKELEGKLLTGFATEFEGDSLKSILLDFDGNLIRVGVAWETIKLFTAAKIYKISGKIAISNIKAEIDPFFCTSEDEAKEKLKDLIEEFPSFEGGITITNA